MFTVQRGCILRDDSARHVGLLRAPIMPTEGELIDDLRSRTIACGLVLSTDELRECLSASGGDVRKAASTIAATAPKPKPPVAPMTPPGLRTPAKPDLIVCDDFALAPPTAAVVRVGVGVCVRRASDGKILVGERHGSHGAGKVAFPGGHLEMGESWDACARREVEEETGLLLPKPTKHIATTNDPMPADAKHYITIFMLAAAPENLEPQNLEPHKCKGWVWMSWQELKALPKEKLFVSLSHFLAENPVLFDEDIASDDEEEAAAGVLAAAAQAMEERRQAAADEAAAAATSLAAAAEAVKQRKQVAAAAPPPPPATADEPAPAEVSEAAPPAQEPVANEEPAASGDGGGGGKKKKKKKKGGNGERPSGELASQ